MLKKIFVLKNLNLIIWFVFVVTSMTFLVINSYKLGKNGFDSKLIRKTTLSSIMTILSSLALIDCFYKAVIIKKRTHNENKMSENQREKEYRKSNLSENNKNPMNFFKVDWTSFILRLILLVLLGSSFYSLGVDGFSWPRLLVCVFVFLSTILLLVIEPPKQPTKNNEKETINKLEKKDVKTIN